MTTEPRAKHKAIRASGELVVRWRDVPKATLIYANAFAFTTPGPKPLAWVAWPGHAFLGLVGSIHGAATKQMAISPTKDAVITWSRKSSFPSHWLLALLTLVLYGMLLTWYVGHSLGAVSALGIALLLTFVLYMLKVYRQIFTAGPRMWEAARMAEQTGRVAYEVGGFAAWPPGHRTAPGHQKPGDRLRQALMRQIVTDLDTPVTLLVYPRVDELIKLYESMGFQKDPSGLLSLSLVPQPHPEV